MWVEGKKRVNFSGELLFILEIGNIQKSNLRVRNYSIGHSIRPSSRKILLN